MIKPTLAICDASIFGPGAKRFQFDCVHGQTSAVLVPGRGAHGYAVALEMLIVRHERAHGCACTRSVGPPDVFPIQGGTVSGQFPFQLHATRGEP